MSFSIKSPDLMVIYRFLFISLLICIRRRVQIGVLFSFFVVCPFFWLPLLSAYTYILFEEFDFPRLNE